MKATLLLTVIAVLLVLPAAASDGVFLLFVSDCSGSMRPHLEIAAVAEAAQARMSLLPGDFVGRVSFNDRATTDLLSEIRMSADIDNAASVLGSRPEAGTGWTRPSTGLAAAHKLAIEKSAGRRVLLFLLTDAVIAAPTGALSAEEKTLEAEAAKWRALPTAKVFLVAVGNNSQAISRLGNTLGASVIRPEQLSTQRLIAREVTKARTQRASSTPQRPHKRGSTLAVVAIGAGLLVACIVVGKIWLCSEAEPRPGQEEEQGSEPWTGLLRAIVTTDGVPEVYEVRLPNDLCPEGRIPFGPTGIVPLPETEFEVAVESDGAIVVNPMGSAVTVDGVICTGGETPIGDPSEITVNETHIIINTDGENTDGN